MLVLAGAGTGKTRVLTTRIAHILAQRQRAPWEILAVTFTNKAAREMSERVDALIGAGAEGMPWLGTFHAIGAKILRRHAELVGLKSNFTILDTDDQIRLLKQVLQAENIDDKRWPARALAIGIDSWKNRGSTPDKVPPAKREGFANGKGAKLYALYQERLKILNAADFGDLLLEMPAAVSRQCRTCSPTISSASNIFWSTNIRTPTSRNICGCACWRRARAAISAASATTTSRSMAGAAPRSTTSCASRRIFPARRSCGSSAITARPAISSPPPRISSPIMTAGSARPCSPTATRAKSRRVTGVWDCEEEARAIGEDIEQLQRKGHSLDEMAILVRASFQMREFEERFITLGLPYRVIGGPRFYERLEIRDALAYLRCVAQPADDLAFERIVNTPKRGLGDATLQMVHEYARARTRSADAGRARARRDRGAEAKPRATLRDLLADFDRWRSSARRQRRITSWPKWCWTNPAIPTCGTTTNRRKPRAGWKT